MKVTPKVKSTEKARVHVHCPKCTKELPEGKATCGRCVQDERKTHGAPDKRAEKQTEKAVKKIKLKLRKKV
jgi:hypothetical protein